MLAEARMKLKSMKNSLPQVGRRSAERLAGCFRIYACSLKLIQQNGWYWKWVGVPVTCRGRTSSWCLPDEPSQRAHFSDSTCRARVVGVNFAGQGAAWSACLSRTKKKSNQNLLYQEMSTRSGSNLVLRVPINFYSYTCNNA
jgi:hypothetical protein